MFMFSIPLQVVVLAPRLCPIGGSVVQLFVTERPVAQNNQYHIYPPQITWQDKERYGQEVVTRKACVCVCESVCVYG